MNLDLTPVKKSNTLNLSPLSPNQSATVLGHSNGLITNFLSTGGAIIGGISGAAGGAALGAPTIVGAPVGAYAGGVAGAGVGGAAGEALGQAIETKLGQREGIDLGDVAKTGGINAAFEAVGGPILSAGGKLLSKAVSPVVSGAGKVAKFVGDTFGGGIVNATSKSADQSALKETMNALTPKLTAGELREAGAAGRITTPKRGAPKVDFSGDTKFQEIARDAKGLINGKDPNVDIHNLRTGIETLSEKSVKPFLEENKVPFNFEDLQNKLALVHPQSSLKADPSALKTYDRVREEVQSNLYKSLKSTASKSGDFFNSTDLNQLWDARKILDVKSEEELGSKVFGSPEYTGAKAAIQDMRQGLSQFITDSLHFPGQAEQVNKMQEFLQMARSRGIEVSSPQELEGLMKQMGITNTSENEAKAAFFSDSMKKASNLYRAIDNIKTKIPDYLRDNSTFAKRHPLITGAAKVGAGAVGGGAVFGATQNLTGN